MYQTELDLTTMNHPATPTGRSYRGWVSAGLRVCAPSSGASSIFACASGYPPRSAIASARRSTARCGTVPIVMSYPAVYICLQLLYQGIDRGAEGYLVKLLQDGPMEALANAVGLRVAHFGLGILNCFQRQVQLVLMMLDGPAVLRAPVGYDPQPPYSLLLKPG